MSTSTVHKLLLMALCCVVASGCGLSQWAHNGLRLGPNHHPPPVLIADDWIDSGDEHVLPLPPDHLDWWSVFQDPVVNDLVQAAFEQNLTLRQAGTRVLQARASRAITAGNLFPQEQFAFGDFTRIQQSKTVALPAPLRAFDQWDIGFNVSWELDLWGKIRRSIESADARLEASIHEYDAILVSLIAEVATAYVEIRTFEQRLEYARQNVTIQESSLELSKGRAEEGKTGEVGVYLADASLSLTEATIPSLEAGRRQASNRLCTLLGMPPDDLSDLLGEGIGIPQAPPAIAVGIPADLLRRRPDVQQAERQVAAQSAQIGVALSDLFPSIAINGEIYQASENFGDLFRSASTAGAVGPSFRWNILNYGRIANNVRLQDARLLELIANYQNTVLLANQEVEDALAGFRAAQQEVESLRESVADLDESLKLLLILFQEGKIDFSPVFVLQASLRNAQDQLAAAEGQVLINMIAVYRALGGGWQIRCPGFQPQISTTGDLLEDTAAELLPAPVQLVPVPDGELPDSEEIVPIQLPASDEGLIKDWDDD